jgi:S-adenosylmethionine:tRNA ribosyltransferase-isomerase
VKIGDLVYELPAELIAQEPAVERSAARLLVLNDTRVIPARVYGRRPTGGRLELLLCEPVGDDVWEALVRGGPRAGERVLFEQGHGEWLADLGDGRWRVRLDVGMPVLAWLDALGEVPLPPYIRRADGPTTIDRERYQTVFARERGSVAAPTAGLHFTPALFEALAGRGIERTFVTLHVGPGTFLPIRNDDLDGYRMAPERYVLSSSAVGAVGRARAERRRVVAVGTTVVRTLESAAAAGDLAPGEGRAGLFIAPGHAFRIVDALVTNFHLPRTPLLAMVAALAGWERIRAAYETAVRERYRFYSYGDAMLIA